MTKKRKKLAPTVAPTITIETRKVSALRPNPHNAKTHPPEQIRAMAAGIGEFDLAKVSIACDEKGVLLAGHGMRLALIEAERGDEEVNVAVVRGWSPAKKRAFLEADNRFSELGGWDEDKRRRELQWLEGQGFPLLAMGWESGLKEFIAEGAPPAGFPSLGEEIGTEHVCPECGCKFKGTGAKK